MQSVLAFTSTQTIYKLLAQQLTKSCTTTLLCYLTGAQFEPLRIMASTLPEMPLLEKKSLSHKLLKKLSRAGSKQR
jgi:hypothetical protein